MIGLGLRKILCSFKIESTQVRKCCDRLIQVYKVIIILFIVLNNILTSILRLKGDIFIFRKKLKTILNDIQT